MTPVFVITAPVMAPKNGGNCTLTTKQSVGSLVSISDKTAAHGMDLRNSQILNKSELAACALQNELACNVAMISLASDATANKAVVFLRSVVQTSSLRSVVLTGNHLGNPVLQVLSLIHI